MATSHEAEAQATELLRAIYRRVRTMLHPHHAEHEPGGKDQLRLPLGFLKNVTITDPAVGQALVIDSVDANDFAEWVNGAGGGTGGGIGQAFFEATATITVGTVPGPTNLTGGALTISRVLMASDGIVTGSITAAGAFSLDDSSDDSTGLTYTWSDGVQLSITISTVGTGDDTPTYLTADVYFTVAS